MNVKKTTTSKRTQGAQAEAPEGTSEANQGIKGLRGPAQRETVQGLSRPVLTATKVSITNEAGGTTDLPEGLYRFQVNAMWDDEECGVRMRGTLLDPDAIALARSLGSTGGEESDIFDPSAVFVSEFKCQGGDAAIAAAWGQWQKFQNAFLATPEGQAAMDAEEALRFRRMARCYGPDLKKGDLGRSFRLRSEPETLYTLTGMVSGEDGMQLVGVSPKGAKRYFGIYSALKEIEFA